MFDGIHRPEAQAPKPKSAAWAQEVTEVHTKPKSKTFHPVKNVKEGHNKRTIFLLVVLLLVFSGVGYYFWQVNENIKETPIVVEEDTVVTAEEKPVEEEEVVEDVAMIFPDDYFLSEDEAPEGFVAEERANEFTEIEDIQFLYKDVEVDAIDETWTKTYGDHTTVMILKYKSNDLLDVEADKIMNNTSVEIFGVHNIVIIFRKNEFLGVIFSNAAQMDDIEPLLEAFNTKWEGEELTRASRDQILEEIEKIKLSEAAIKCYLVYNPSFIEYFPNIEATESYVNLANADHSEKDMEFYEIECEELKADEEAWNNIGELLQTDNDGDGLTAYFEQLYGSDDTKEDTDGDGYDDLTEVENGYSPIIDVSAAEEASEESIMVYDTYVNEDFAYSISIPKDWIAVNDPFGNEIKGIQLWPEKRNLGNHHIRVIVMPLSESEALDFIDSDYELKEGILDGVSAYVKFDGSAMILNRPSNIEAKVDSFILMYDYSLAEEINLEYMKIFEEMVASFKFL